jgi:hypothetical protein
MTFAFFLVVAVTCAPRHDRLQNLARPRLTSPASAKKKARQCSQDRGTLGRVRVVILTISNPNRASPSRAYARGHVRTAPLGACASRLAPFLPSLAPILAPFGNGTWHHCSAIRWRIIGRPSRRRGYAGSGDHPYLRARRVATSGSRRAVGAPVSPSAR